MDIHVAQSKCFCNTKKRVNKDKLFVFSNNFETILKHVSWKHSYSFSQWGFGGCIMYSKVNSIIPNLSITFYLILFSGSLIITNGWWLLDHDFQYIFSLYLNSMISFPNKIIGSNLLAFKECHAFSPFIPLAPTVWLFLLMWICLHQHF